ncbi:MAG: hypothetical protein ABIG63_13195, partial [Chloroflexota bacterium]
CQTTQADDESGFTTPEAPPYPPQKILGGATRVPSKIGLSNTGSPQSLSCEVPDQREWGATPKGWGVRGAG